MFIFLMHAQLLTHSICADEISLLCIKKPFQLQHLSGRGKNNSVLQCTHGWTWNNSKMQRGKTASFFRLMMIMMLIATFLLLFVLSFHLSIISVLLPFEPKMMMEHAHTISCHDSPTSLSLVIIKIITLHYVNSHHMWTLFPPALRKRELKYEKMPPVILFAKSALLNTHSPKIVLHYVLLKCIFYVATKL